MFEIPKKFAFISIAILLVLLFSSDAQAYIGPGAGFAFIYSFLVIFLIAILAPLFLLVWPVWYLFHRLKAGKFPPNARAKRVIVLGLDGLDPNLMEEFMREGKLPNFQALKRIGCFHRLGTTAPSVSPVAWSTFQTGVNPCKHNIFDFLDRDRHNYVPILSSAFIGGVRDWIKIGKLRLPKGKPALRLLRKSQPFWKFLGQNGVFSTVLRVPITFPPEKFFGLSLSGMCVPDIKGSQGTFAFYTTAETDATHTGGVRIKLNWQSNIIHTYIPGPANALDENQGDLKIPLLIRRENQSVSLFIQGKKYKLILKEYSDWIKVRFKAGFGLKAQGICRFYLKALEPELELYLSPINLDPENPSLPISHPFAYSIYLSKLQGSFATLGLAEDTWALNEGVLTDEAFLEQVWEHHLEREKMFFHSLNIMRKGTLVCVFDTSDRVQHMFWRYHEKEHPANRVSPPTLNFDPIADMYLKMDDLLGRTLKCIGQDDVLLVISDHGFASFRRCFNLNAYLRENGYLQLKAGCEGGDYFKNVDWSKTKAFAVGLGGLFINLKGREKSGSVAPGSEYENLKAELKARLTGLKDPLTGEIAINSIYSLEQFGDGPYRLSGPDLLLGFNPGYRIAWDSATGNPAGEVFSDNIKKWSGDHCIDYKQVPGIFFATKAINHPDPELKDIAPTIIDLFSLKPPDYMEGRPLMQEHPDSVRAKH